MLFRQTSLCNPGIMPASLSSEHPIKTPLDSIISAMNIKVHRAIWSEIGFKYVIFVCPMILTIHKLKVKAGQTIFNQAADTASK